MRWVHDVFGNCVTIAEFAGAEAKELRFESNIWLDHSPSNAPDFQIEDYAKTYPFTYSPEEMPDLAPVDQSGNTPTRTRPSIAGCGASCARAGAPTPACCS